MSVAAIPESPHLHPRTMSGEVQLRKPSQQTSRSRLEHQDTIILVDDELEAETTAQYELMATSPPRNELHINSAVTVGNSENQGVVAMQSSCSAISSGLPQINGPLSDTSNSLSVTSQSQYNSPPIVPNIPPVVTKSPPPAASSKHRNTASAAKVNPNEKVAYGELVVLGYNGSLAHGDSGRKKSKFILCRRQQANGVKPSSKQFMANPKEKKAVSEGATHSVSYTLSRTQAVVVEYEKDEDTDMFQIGRSSESPIDFVVTDTIPGPQRLAGQTQVAQSTISRFSCRICVQRTPPYTARIYAAGFDQHNHIFLGEKASKWYNQQNEIDGLTTNGVLLIHPRGQFSDKNCNPGMWRECSVRGGIYSLRETRSVPSKSQKVDAESNILQDGTLIDLCGATLVWRSRTGLHKAPSEKQLEAYIERINASRPQCPVGLNTLVLPKRNAKIEKARQPYVYLACGHVHGSHEWKRGDDSPSTRTCPMCMKEGPFVQVQVGRETSLYTDNQPLTHIFTPCAHLTSQNTARYWSSVAIPYGCQGFRAMCPFCATSLGNPGSTEKSQGFIKLIFQDNTEF